ncbi:MAG: serine hydrolase [Bacteroidetes bacterium]|nr:serine hydrolase [Bacteroidota bacterium]
MKVKIWQLFRWSVVFVAVTALALPLLFTIGCGQKGADSTDAEAIAKARYYMNELQERFKIPGMAVAVAIADSIVWAEGFGYANLEKKIPATPQTMFRAGSVSKVFTAGAVALLYEQRKLDLDAPVQKYVPEFSDKGYVVTTRQLAGHLSGIRHYNLDEEEDKKHYDDVISALELFRDDDLVHPPGEKYSYSSYGWNLISTVVQRAAGQSFLDYMREHIFTPLNMVNTAADDITADIPNRSLFYDGQEVAKDIDLSYKWASGGFLTSVEDLVRYGSAFLPDSDFLKPETLELLFTNQKTNDGKAIPHGIGWLVGKFENGNSLYYHPGSLLGGQAILVVQPKDRIVVAMLANRSSGFGETAANQIACYFLGLGENECPEIEGERKLRIEKHMRLQMLSSAINEWETAIETGNLKTVMATFSENFQSLKWENKTAMRRHFQQIFASGSTAVDTENLHFRFHSRGYPLGALTYIEGIKTKGAFGTTSIRLTFVREESGPMITNLEFMEL